VKNIKSLLSLFLFIIIGFGSLDEFENPEQSPKVTSDSNPSVTISASKLYKEYNENEIAADEKYKGKIIEITGVIRDIGNDIMDNAYITLVGNEYFGDIQCYFNEKSVVAKLSKGKKITVIGSCSGLMINVQINNCIVR
tara:strand:+ start:306 stop:722 length:417 start_codon:yes stop_codon:yes gene_type:complete